MTRVIYAVPALMMLSAVTTMPVIAEAQTIIIINGSGAQPYYGQPYPYAYPQRQIVYDEPVYPSAYGYYPSYYNGYYPTYGYGYYRPHRPYWGW